MLIIGVDFHPQFQQIVWVDTDTGELQEQRLQHREEAETFYRALAAAGQKVRVGMEASGHARWSERLLAELQFELWMGDATQIQSKRGRKQKTACLSETAPVCPSSSTWRSGGSTPCTHSTAKCATFSCSKVFARLSRVRMAGTITSIGAVHLPMG